MKKNLILLNWVRRESTVLETLAREMPKHFDQVIIVGRDVSHIYDHLRDLPVDMRLVSRASWFIALFKLPMILARSEFWREVSLARKTQKLSAHYLTMLFRELWVGELLSSSAVKVMRQAQNGEKWVVLSLWFDGRAYGAALTKRTIPQVTAASLAHSVEIDPTRNPYHILMLKHHAVAQLDLVAFISDVVKERYIENARPFYPLALDRIKTYYLGSRKPHEVLVRGSEDGIFRIVTCSGVSKVKRLNLLAEALAGWTSSQPIEWTHLGAGLLFDELQSLARELNTSSVPVTVNLLGWVEHNDIFEYYAANWVDLFVNVSSSEGLPVAIMEAISYGIPVVATDVGGNSEIVNEENGRLLSADPTPEEIRNAILFIAEMSPSDRQVLREASFTRWQERFFDVKTMETLATALLQVRA